MDSDTQWEICYYLQHKCLFDELIKWINEWMKAQRATTGVNANLDDIWVMVHEADHKKTGLKIRTAMHQSQEVFSLNLA